MTLTAQCQTQLSDAERLADPTTLSDAELIEEVSRLAATERRATAALVRSLAELDARRLYLGEGCASLFVYCTRVLHLAEGAAYNRIEAARAARRFPVIFEALERGSVTLTAVRLLAPHFTAENHERVLAAARHKSKREVEQLVAALSPKPAAPAILRKLPAAAGSCAPEESAASPADAILPGAAEATIARRLPVAAESCVPEGPAASLADAILRGPAEAERVADAIRSAPIPRRCEPPAPVASPPSRPALTSLAPERYRLQLTVSGETHGKLRRAQDLLRHAVPNGDLATIVDRALTALLDELDRRRLAAVISPRESRSPRRGSRHIPAAVRREVWRRDGGRCAFAGARGRCAERGFLEFHHVEPFATGGAATSGNIELRCRAHNAYEARLVFGEGGGAGHGSRL